ncbi:hypothetical protein [Sunxiuqinia indica]|uniref:hypothetical protein n=1 Tax=Sunxiuqinia indica TaxID=2692584 RepID=UPI001359F5DA|nr:hypothetical protein [Sunxiuqinia indica]
MKTKKMRLIALMITLAAVMTGVNAEAQRRETGSDSRRTYKQSKQYNDRNSRKSDHRDYSTADRSRKPRNDQRAYHKSDRNNRHDWDRNRSRDQRSYADRNRYNNRDDHWNRNNRDSRNDHWNRNNKKSYRYSEKYGNKHYKYDRRYEYRHPKYGRVYSRFCENPMRIRHQHGDYYFYGGHYYRHHHGVGYVRVEFPTHLVFEHLPFHCDRFWVGDHLYYRHGDLVFEPYGYGYRIAPRINLGIHFSAHF